MFQKKRAISDFRSMRLGGGLNDKRKREIRRDGSIDAVQVYTIVELDVVVDLLWGAD